LFTLPPPRTTSRGSRAAVNRSPHVRDGFAPFFLAVLFQAVNSNLILERRWLLWQACQLHRFEEAVHYHRGTEAGAQSVEQPPSVPNAARSLPGGGVAHFTGRLQALA
jgi:hypothetical protein